MIFSSIELLIIYFITICYKMIILRQHAKMTNFMCNLDSSHNYVILKSVDFTWFFEVSVLGGIDEQKIILYVNSALSNSNDKCK